MSKPVCTFSGCKLPGMRRGKRKYSDRCHLHQRKYGAASADENGNYFADPELVSLISDNIEELF